MKQKLLLFAFTLLSTMLFSQAVPMALEDSKTTGGSQNMFLKAVTKTDAFGNIYTAGATINGVGDYDIFIKKVNSSGVQLWQQQIPGGVTGGMDFAAGMAVTDTYVILTGGITTSTANPTTDIFTMKLDASSGSVTWTSYYNGSGNYLDAGKHVVIDGSGNIYITGGGYNASYNTDYITLKYNSSGTQQWVKVWDYLGYDDCAIKVATSGSNLTITGAVTTATASVYKLATLTLAQSTGSLLATNVSTAITTSSVDIVSDLTTDGSGNIIIVGNNYVSGQGNNFYIQKLAGNTLLTVWTYTWNGSSSLDDAAKAVQCDASSNVIIAGYSTSSTLGKELTILKLNSSGVLQYSVTSGFNGDDEAADLIVDASGNSYITGYSTNQTLDYYTAKYSTTLTKTWEISADGNGYNDKATNITLDSLDNVIVTGQSEITLGGSYEYITYKYVQKDVITPTDFNGETPNPNYLYFKNSGQIVDTNYTSVADIRFYTNWTSPNFYFRSHNQSYIFARIDTVSTTADTLHRIDLSFNSCNETSETYPMEQQKDGYLNYYMGYLTEQITNVKGNKRLITPNLYNNIDLMTSSNQNGIKYYFIVKPGGDMRDIKLEFTGATSFSLNGTTNALSINSSIGSITFDKPVAYQLTSANATVAVTSFSPTWTTNGASNKYKFNDGAYTSSLTLVIEVDQGNAFSPSTTTGPNIEWSTYFGGQSQETIKDITYGSSNNLYIVGQTTSPASDFPQAPGATNIYQATNFGAYDGFVGKFDQTGILQWATFVGGAGSDVLNSLDIASNGSGDLYCVGTTQSNNLLSKPKASTTLNDNSFGGNDDGMIFQLSQSGQTCTWLSYYGGSGTDQLTKCKFDALGNLFVTGGSNSSNLTVVGTSPQYTHINVGFDAYIMKLNNSTFDFDWATYVPGKTLSTDCGGSAFNDLDFNSLNDVFVGGYSSGNSYPVVHPSGSTALASTNNCKADGIITQFDNTGQMLWSTHLGSTESDNVLAVKVDGRDLYVGGNTHDITTFPTHFSGNLYANTTKILSSITVGGFFAYFDYLNHGEHSTLIGSDDGDDGVQDIIIDAVHNIYLVGYTGGTNLEQPSGGNPSNTWSENNKGHYDDFIFVIKQGTTDVIWSTLLGGDLTDQPFAATIDGNNNLFIAGYASSATNFPWNDGGGNPVHFQGSLVGGGPNDGSITRFKLSPVNLVGIKENQAIADGIFIYPNPTQSILNIKLSDASQKKNFTIFNTMGQIITTGTLANSSTIVNVSSLAEGMYFIEISDKTTKVTAKFIKQ